MRLADIEDTSMGDLPSPRRFVDGEIKEVDRGLSIPSIDEKRHHEESRDPGEFRKGPLDLIGCGDVDDLSRGHGQKYGSVYGTV